MTPPRKNTRRNGRRRSPRTDLWRSVPPAPVVQPVTPVTDPTALIRSLGAPPLPGRTTYAEHYLTAVVERAATLAGGLAAAAGVSAEPDND